MAGRQDHAFALGSLDHFVCVLCRVQVDPESDSSLWVRSRHLGWEVFGNGRSQRFASLLVGPAHVLEVRFELAALHQLVEHDLPEQVGAKVEATLELHQSIERLRGNEHPTDAQTWCDDLGESRYGDDLAGVVEGPQRRWIVGATQLA